MLNLAGYKLTFSDEFNARSISQDGASTVWSDIRSEFRVDAHSDIGFGRSSFMDASSGTDPFKVANGALTITAVPDRTPYGSLGSWESGLIHSKGEFAQTYGYFEIRADFSNTPGAWDAFWLLPVTPTDTGRAGWQELDVVEHYGNHDSGVYSWMHTTDPSANPSADHQVYSNNPQITSGYHTYGMMWTPTTISFYVDGELKGTRATPSDMHGPMYLLANLAVEENGSQLGSTYQTSIDYIRAYSADPNAKAVVQGTVSAPDGRDPGLYGATGAATSVSLTTSAFVAQLSNLADKKDLQTVVLSDGRVLAFSSVELMKTAIGRYASVLEKVDGGVSFEVTTQAATWRKIQTFDMNGNLTLSTEYGLKDGRITKSVVTQADGAVQSTWFDAKGQQTSRVEVAKDGTNTTLTYDPATAKLTQQVVKEPDGDILTTRYVNGVKTLAATESHEGWKQQVTYDSKTGATLTDYTLRTDGSATNKTYTAGVLTKVNTKNADGSLDNWTYKITGKSYVTEHQVNDAKGAITLIERLHDDGTFEFRELRGADGSRETVTYNKAGGLVTDTTINADGSKLFKNYLQDGSGDVWTERSDAAGTLLVRNIAHANGKQDVYSFSNGQTLVGTSADDTFYFRTTSGSKMVYGGGNDTVLSFDGNDKIAIGHDWATKFADLNMVQSGQDVVICFDDHNSIVMKYAKIADIRPEYFIMA